MYVKRPIHMYIYGLKFIYIKTTYTLKYKVSRIMFVKGSVIRSFCTKNYRIYHNVVYKYGIEEICKGSKNL